MKILQAVTTLNDQTCTTGYKPGGSVSSGSGPVFHRNCAAVQVCTRPYTLGHENMRVCIYMYMCLCECVCACVRMQEMHVCDGGERSCVIYKVAMKDLKAAYHSHVVVKL